MAGRYQAYPDYKDSGVQWLEDIPNHWSIFDAKRIFNNRRESALFHDEQLAASQTYGIIPQSLMMKLNGSKVMLALKGTSSFRHVEQNDFVISLRSFEGGIEHSAYKGCVSPAYTVLGASKEIVPHFYRYLFKSKPFIVALQSTTDSLRDGKSITFDQFGAISLILPAVNEQEKIANFLSYETVKIDALIEKQQALIELLKEKRQAVISNAVTKGLNPEAPMKDSGVEWLGEIPEHWTTLKGAFIGKLFGSESVSENDVALEGEIPFIKVSTLLPNGFQVDNPEFYLKKNSGKCFKTNVDYVVFPKRGGAIFTNKVNIVTFDSIIDPNLMGWQIGEKARSEWMAYLLKLRGLEDIADVSTVPQINNKHIEPIKFPIAPLDEQNEILNYLSKKLERFDKLKVKVEIAISLLQERRTALISAAVTGKIDVRDWLAPESKAGSKP